MLLDKLIGDPSLYKQYLFDQQVAHQVGSGLGSVIDSQSVFFKAEDGIRDDLVTGVQTCALPISPPQSSTNCYWSPRTAVEHPVARVPPIPSPYSTPVPRSHPPATLNMSPYTSSRPPESKPPRDTPDHM